MLMLFYQVTIGQEKLDSLLYEYEDQIGSDKIATGLNISSYYDNDDLFKSLEYANEILAFAQEFGTTKDLLTAQNRLGIVYYKMGNLSKSNDHFLEALVLVTQLNSKNPSNESRLLNNVANNYGELQQPQLAIVYYKRSLALKKKIFDSARYSITLNNMALTYSSLRYYDSAYIVLKEALKIDVLLKDEVSVAYSNGSLGEVFLDQGKVDSAQYYLVKSLTFFENTPNSDYVLAYYHQKLGEIDLLMQDVVNAKLHFEKGLRSAQKVGAQPIQKGCYRGLEMVSKELSDFKAAHKYSRLYAEMQDSLYKRESAQKLIEIETSYQIKTKEQEISILNANAEADKYKFYAALAIIFLVVVLLGFVYYRYYFKAKANYLLEQKNSTIEKQHSEIMDGVKYAKGIQEAILPDFSIIKSSNAAAYLYYKPAQVVSGDFYWVDEIDGKKILVVADGTGHGVPGAFLSVMGTSLLKQIISEKRVCSPDKILCELHTKVVEGLGQSKLGSSLKDGMDVSVCVLDKANKRLSFAGAKRPLLLKQGSNLQTIKGSRNSVGGSVDKMPSFDVHYFDVEQGDTIILFTDGVIDQFGGDNNKKYLIKRLEEVANRATGINGIKDFFENEIEHWKGANEQTDDMLLLAVEI